MMKRSFVLLVLVLIAGVAQAQPGQPYPPPQPDPQQPQPQPYPAQPQPYPAQPQPYPAQPQQPYGYRYAQPQPPPMTVQLTLDEQWLLQRGYISDGQALGGGAVALLFGWGLGHAVQGRWSEKGYIFTLGEAATFGVAMWGMFGLFANCFEGCSQPRQDRYEVMFVGGMIGNAVFRIWEVVDAFTGPGAHNRRLDELRGRMGLPPRYSRLSPYVMPSRDRDGGAVAGVSFRF